MGVQDRPKVRLDQVAAMAPQLFRILRTRIIQGELEPGARLSESEVAAAYEVSRQPVREAFIKLVEEGLLEVRPQRGSFVRRIDVAAVMDARFVREAIEADVVKILAGRSDPALDRDLRRQIAEQEERASEGDHVGFIALDERFHRTLAEAAGHRQAWGVIESVKSQMDRVRYLSTRRFPMDALVRQHGAVAQAVAEGNLEAAEVAIRTHLRTIINDLPAVVANHPAYFDAPEADLPSGYDDDPTQPI